MGIKTKLYFSLASTILFAIAMIVFFINGNPTEVVLVMYFLCVHYTKYSSTKKE